MNLSRFSREELEQLVIDLAKRWLAHDGLWFQAVEKRLGLAEAIELDCQAWEKFSALEAQRIMALLDIEPGGGLLALQQALLLRLYSFVNSQEVTMVAENRLIFKMVDCRVQAARHRKKMPLFPCKPVGQVEYSVFARTIDSRIKTRCLHCPPDDHPADSYCSWEFTLAQ